MPVTEIAGNFSGFGDQLSSRRTTFPKYSQLTGRRVIGVNPQCEEALLQWVKGSDSPGPTVELPSSIGHQPTSNKSNAPRLTIGKKLSSPTTLNAPGPGAYGKYQHVESSLRDQTRSTRLSEPRCKIGHEIRVPGKWRHQTEGEGTCPASLHVRPPSGWLGEEARKHTFSNKARRYAFGKGFPGLTPTFLGSPGAVYNSPAAIGTQQLSHKASAPRAAAVKSTRAAFLRQFVSHDQARVNYGREGPGPAFYEGRRGSGAVGSQVYSMRKTAPSFGMGSGSRFAQAVPTGARAASARSGKRDWRAEMGWSTRPQSATESHFSLPGPGEYRVQ